MSMSIKADPSGTFGEILVNGAVVAKLPVTGNAVIPGLVGTVSQSGGVPTGAVVERGSNANGQYVRFADGTQICVHVLASSAVGQQSWTYPAAFSANLYNLATVDATGSYYANTTYSSLSSMTFGAYSGTSRVSVGVLLLTIGRWF